MDAVFTPVGTQEESRRGLLYFSGRTRGATTRRPLTSSPPRANVMALCTHVGPVVIELKEKKNKEYVLSERASERAYVNAPRPHPPPPPPLPPIQARGTVGESIMLASETKRSAGLPVRTASTQSVASPLEVHVSPCAMTLYVHRKYQLYHLPSNVWVSGHTCTHTHTLSVSPVI